MDGGKMKIYPFSNKQKKLEQKVRFIFYNPHFKRSISVIRRKFSDLSKKNKLLEQAIINGRENKKIAKNFRSWSNLRNNAELNKSVSEIIYTYKLTPIDLWREGLISLILDGVFKISENYFLGNNFLIFVDVDEPNYTPKVYIQIFEDTSLHDIRKGWHLVEQIRKTAIGKKRFYPLKNLEMANQIFKIDKTDKNLSDWRKQELIFGDVSISNPENWGLIESKNRKKLKQVRYRYRKRFEAKS